MEIDMESPMKALQELGNAFKKAADAASRYLRMMAGMRGEM